MKPEARVAINVFNNDLNCAQSVLFACSEYLNFDKELALRISCGFGSGMGRLQEVCGAVSGSFMALGLHNSNIYSENSERKEKTAAMIQDFSTIFKLVHGTIKCSELLNCDLNSEEGQKYFEQNDLKKMVCEKCISSSVNIINELITHVTEQNPE